MKILIIGFGSIGKKHYRILRSRGVEVCVYDPLDHGTDGVNFLEDPGQTADIEAVIVASPNYTHLDWMERFSDQHLFVEKPLVASIDHLNRLKNLSFERTVSVASNYFFHPVMQNLQEIVNNEKYGRPLYGRLYFGHYLPYWRPGTDYRQTYSSRSEEGGGILLDAMSHHFFWIDRLFGGLRMVHGFLYNKQELGIDVEEIASLHLVTQSGMVFDCNVNYLDQCRRLMVEIVAEKATVVWEQKMKGSSVETLTLFKGNHIIHQDIHIIDPEDAYERQMDHWLSCIDGSEKPVQDLVKGIELISIILMVQKEGIWMA